MAARSLGTLTLDLVAKTGGYVAGLSKAERESEKWRRKVKRQVSDVGKAFAGLSVAAIAGVGLLTRKIIQESNAQEAALAQLRRGLESTGGVVGRSLDELSREATRLQGISIFGDDQILQAQAQLVTFTNITGEAFDRTTKAALDLSTRMDQDLKSSVLQLGKALNDPVANLGALGRAGIQFSDAQKDTIKALAETNRLAEAQDIILKELERQFGGSAEAARDTLGGSLAALNNAFGDLFEQEEGAAELTGTINELTGILQDPSTVEAVSALTNAIITGFSDAIIFIRDTVNTIKFLGEEFAAFIHGPAIGDLPRLNEQLDELIEKREKLTNASGRNSRNQDTRLAEIDTEIEKTKELIKLSEEFARTPTKPPAIAQTPAKTQASEITVVDKEAEKKLKKLNSEYESYLEKLRSANQLTKEATELDQLKFEIQSGGLKGLDSAKQNELEQLAREVDLKTEIAAINEEALSIQESLRTEEEAIAESYERRREIILKNTEVTGKAQQELLARLEADRQEQLENTTANREAQAMEDKIEAIRDSMRTQEEIIEDSYRKRREFVLEYERETGEAQTELLVELAEDRQKQLEELEAKRRFVALRNAEELFGNLADLAKTFAGEQSAIYRALFALEKAAAIARSIVAIQAGIAEAASLPFPANIAAMGVVASETASIVSTIQGTTIQGQAHDGLMSVPTTGTYLLEKGERVTTERTSAKLDRTLDQVQNNNGGQSVQNLRINNVIDPAFVGDYMSGPDGDRVINNYITRNQTKIRQIARG